MQSVYLRVIFVKGERHLKIWSFRRPGQGSPGSLVYKGVSMGSQRRAQMSKDKVMMNRTKNCDVVMSVIVLSH